MVVVGKDSFSRRIFASSSNYPKHCQSNYFLLATTPPFPARDRMLILRKAVHLHPRQHFKKRFKNGLCSSSSRPSQVSGQGRTEQDHLGEEAHQRSEGKGKAGRSLWHPPSCRQDVLESFLSALLPRVRFLTPTRGIPERQLLWSGFAKEQYSGSCFGLLLFGCS